MFRHWSTILLLAVVTLGGSHAEDIPIDPKLPDMMDPLGRYQLELPTGWAIRGTHDRLKGFVIGDGTESFVAIYKDGVFAIEDVVPAMRELCECPIPEGATLELLDDSAYPSQIIIFANDKDTLVLGASVFPKGVFMLVSILKNRTAVSSLRSVLIQARPGPARAN